MLFYGLLGILMEFPNLALRFWFMTTLEIEVAHIGFMMSTAAIPWTLKPLYGLVSDTFPIAGLRRKPYIITCNLLCAALWCVLSVTEQTQTTVLVCLVAIQLVTCFADVMYDAAMVALSQDEEGDQAGEFQSLCWAWRSGGAFVAAGAGGVALHYTTPQTVFALQTVPPLLLVLTATLLFTEAPCRTAPVSATTSLRRIVDAASLPGLWKPAVFVFVFAATPGSGTAWFYYMVNELHFSPNIMGILACIRHGSMMVGAILYRRYCRGVPFRRFFGCLVLASSMLSLTPLVLLYHWNRAVGISDLFFVSGDDVFLAALGQVAMMPCLVLAAKLCPKGIEASLYATFVSTINVAGIVSEYLGSSLTLLIGISHADFGQMDVLILICSASSLIPLCFLCFLPAGGVADVAQGQVGGRDPALHGNSTGRDDYELTGEGLDEMIGLTKGV